MGLDPKKALEAAQEALALARKQAAERKPPQHWGNRSKVRKSRSKEPVDWYPVTKVYGLRFIDIGSDLQGLVAVALDIYDWHHFFGYRVIEAHEWACVFAPRSSKDTGRRRFERLKKKVRDRLPDHMHMEHRRISCGRVAADTIGVKVTRAAVKWANAFLDWRDADREDEELDTEESDRLRLSLYREHVDKIRELPLSQREKYLDDLEWKEVFGK